MKTVYVVWFFPEGGPQPEMFVFGNRRMAENFMLQMMNEYGIEGEKIFVKQYSVIRAKQEFGHCGVRVEH